MHRFTAAAIAAAAALSAVPAVASADAPSSDQSQRCDDGTVTLSGPATLWPPNHKYRDLMLTAVADDPMMPVTLMTVATHDEYLASGEEMNGAGNTAEDAAVGTDSTMGTGSASTDIKLRGQRSGRGDGRVYTITATTNFSDMASMTPMMCTRTFTVSVPHDQRDKNATARTRTARRAAARKAAARKAAARRAAARHA